MDATNTVNEGINRVHNGVKRQQRGVASELNNLIADVEDMLGRLTNVADVDIARLRQQVRDRINTARDTLTEGGRHIAETAQEAAGATDEYVRASPWQAVGIAAVVGALTGYLLARR